MPRQETLFQRRRRRVRHKLRQQAQDRVRLSVYRSGQHIYAQLIDDAAGRTLIAASSAEATLRKDGVRGGTIAGAESVGKLLAERAQKAEISSVQFDRGGYLYHGRVKALADAARAGGLQF